MQSHSQQRNKRTLFNPEQTHNYYYSVRLRIILMIKRYYNKNSIIKGCLIFVHFIFYLSSLVCLFNIETKVCNITVDCIDIRVIQLTLSGCCTLIIIM